MSEAPGISHLWLVRHGQSAGNLAAAAAELAGTETIDIAEPREMDVPLSPLGVRQAQAVGAWFAEKPARPTLIVASPYARAQRTAAEIAAALPGSVPLRIDERLREKEMGSLDRLTRAGITRRFPREVELRARLGKFYYRPPGGESWCDVLLRVRAVLDHLRLVRTERRVLLVAHQVIVLCARVALEHLDERGILDIDARGDVLNCGITAYTAEAGGELALRSYNVGVPLAEHGAPATAEPDRGVAPT